MNQSRRQTLKDAAALLDIAKDSVSRVLNEEENSLDNIPENLQFSERYENMEAAIENLEEAISCIEDAVIAINNTINI